MNSARHSFYIASLFLTALAPAGTAAEKVPTTDPVVLTLPKEAPEFREVLRGAEWDQRFAKALKSLGDLEALAKSSAGEAGYVVYGVDPNGQGKALDLDGATITRIDSQPIRYEQEFDDLRTNGDQTITVLTRAGDWQELKIHAGKLGVFLRPVLCPEIAFLRHAPRQAKWDTYAAVGAAKCLADPELAETAWRRAVAAGYVPDELSDFCGMQCAWRQGRNDDAVGWCASMDARPDKYPSLSRSNWSRQVALANFKIEQALAMRMAVDPGPAKMDGAPADYLQTLLGAWHDRPESLRLLPSPGDQALHATSLLGAMDPHLPEGVGDSEWRRSVVDTLAEHKEYFHESVPTDHYERFVQVPREDAANVDVVFHVVCTAADNQSAQYSKIFSAGLVNCDRDEYLDRALYPAIGGMLKIGVEPTGGARVWQDSDRQELVEGVSVLEEAGEGREFTVRLLHAAGRDEVWVNRRRLIYLPSREDPKKVGFFFTMVGTRVAVKVEYSRIESDAAK